MFVVAKDNLFDSVEAILEVYSKQHHWTQAMTDTIVNGLAKLAPGQRLELSSDNFRISGKDSDGHWSFNLNYPRVIQKADATVLNLLNTRIAIGAQLNDLNKLIADLQLDRDQVQALYGKAEGAMHKYANSIAPPIKV